MAGYQGDFRLGDTLDVKFCTVTTTGAPTTLAGSPVISAYVGNSLTQITAGITLSVDFDSVTGLNNVRVVASNGNGYATASNYSLIITTGTVGGTSVVGYEVGSFSIENRSALMPTTAALTLDVSAGGEAGLDWANIGSKTTTNALTNTSIITTQKVDVDTIKTNPVVNGGTITFPTTATLASTTNITAGTVTTATNLTNAPTAGDFTATMKTSIGTAVAASAVASVTGNVGGNVVGSVGSVTAGVSVGAGGIQSTSFAASAIDAAAIATDAIGSNEIAATAVTKIAAGVFARAFTAAYGSLTFEQIMEVLVASQAAKTSGGATTTFTIRNIADSADVIVATVDASGNRSAVTITP